MLCSMIVKLDDSGVSFHPALVLGRQRFFKDSRFWEQNGEKDETGQPAAWQCLPSPRPLLFPPPPPFCLWSCASPCLGVRRDDATSFVKKGQAGLANPSPKVAGRGSVTKLLGYEFL